MSILAKQLTENSWMLNNTKLNKNVGLVNQKNGKFFLIGNALEFNSLSEVAKHLGGKLLDSPQEISEEEKEANAVSDINGFPVKHDEVHDIEEIELNGEKIQTYKIKKGSKKIYAAGYFGLLFKSGACGAFCPLLKTLIDHGFIGPYNNEIDLEFNLKK